MKVTSDVGPWAIVPEWVLDAQVSDRAVRLYGLLGRYADQNGTSFPLRRTLLSRLRCSESSLDRAAKELVSIGALHIEHRKGDDGNNQANLWTLRMASPQRGGGVTGAATPGVNGDAHNESHLERETTSSAAAPRKPTPERQNGIRKVQRDAIWDCLTDIFGPVTAKRNEALRGKHVQELSEAGATPDEIVRRAKDWPNHFDTATMTEPALVKWWDTLGRKPLRRR